MANMFTKPNVRYGNIKGDAEQKIEEEIGGEVKSIKFMTGGSKKLIEALYNGDMSKSAKLLAKYIWFGTRDSTMILITVGLLVLAEKAQVSNLLQSDQQHIMNLLKNMAKGDGIKAKTNCEQAKEFENTFKTILKSAPNINDDKADKIWKKFVKQIGKTTDWRIGYYTLEHNVKPALGKVLNQIYYNAFVSNMPSLKKVKSKPEKVDTSGWEGRYSDMGQTQELSYKDYRKFYVSQGSDGRFLHGNQALDDVGNNGRKLNKKFIASVMERRYAHLQQVKHCIKFFMDKTGDYKFVEKVLDGCISHMEKILENEENEFKKFCKENKLDPSNQHARKLFDGDFNKKAVTRLQNLKLRCGDIGKDTATLFEVYNLIDKVLSGLKRSPGKISNLKLSSSSVDRINKAFESNQIGVGTAEYVLKEGKCYKPFMITSDEPTDRILAELEDLAYDGGNVRRSIEYFCTLVSSIPKELSSMEDFCIEKLPASRSLPNPYR